MIGLQVQHGAEVLQLVAVVLERADVRPQLHIGEGQGEDVEDAVVVHLFLGRVVHQRIQVDEARSQREPIRPGPLGRAVAEEDAQVAGEVGAAHAPAEAIDGELVVLHVQVALEVLELQRMHLHAAGELAEAQVREAEAIVGEAEVGIGMEARLAQHLVAVFLRQVVLALVGEQVAQDELVAAEVDGHVRLAMLAVAEPQRVVLHGAVQVQVAGVNHGGEVLDAERLIGDDDVGMHIVQRVRVVLRLHAELVDEELADGQRLLVEQAFNARGEMESAAQVAQFLVLRSREDGVVREELGQIERSAVQVELQLDRFGVVMEDRGQVADAAAEPQVACCHAQAEGVDLHEALAHLGVDVEVVDGMRVAGDAEVQVAHPQVAVHALLQARQVALGRLDVDELGELHVHLHMAAELVQHLHIEEFAHEVQVHVAVQVHVHHGVHEVLHDEVAAELAAARPQVQVAQVQLGGAQSRVTAVGEEAREGEPVHFLVRGSVVEPAIRAAEADIHARGHALGAAALHRAVEDDLARVPELAQEVRHIVRREGHEQGEVGLLAVHMQVEVHLMADVHSALGCELHLLQLQGAQGHHEHLRGHVVVQVRIELDVLVVEEARVALADHIQVQVGLQLGGDGVADAAEVGLQLMDARGDLLPGALLQVAEGEIAQLQVAQMDVQGRFISLIGRGELLREQQVQAAILVQHQIQVAAVSVDAAHVDVAAQQVPDAEAEVEVLEGVDGRLRGVVGRTEAHVLKVDADEREGLEGRDVAAADGEVPRHVAVDLVQRHPHQGALLGEGHGQHAAEEQQHDEHGPEQDAADAAEHVRTGRPKYPLGKALPFLAGRARSTGLCSNPGKGGGHGLPAQPRTAADLAHEPQLCTVHLPQPVRSRVPEP